MKILLTEARLKELLEYNPLTGLFIRLTNSRGKNSRIGDIAGCLDKNDGYINISIDNKGYRAHRLAILYTKGEFPKYLVDHENGIKHDNRLINLRIGNSSENMQNQTKAMITNSSGFLGVGVHKNGTFKAGIKINGKPKHLGYFKTPELAHAAYIEAKRKLHPFGVL